MADGNWRLSIPSHLEIMPPELGKPQTPDSESDDGDDETPRSSGSNIYSTTCPAVATAINTAEQLMTDYDKINASRYQIVASGSAFADYDSFTDVVIDDIPEAEPTSAMLSFCKRRFLIPFINLLGLVGLRPMTVDASDCSACLGHFQTLVVVTLLFIGYTLQFMTSFRRDRGIVNSNFFATPGNRTTSSADPSIFSGYTQFVAVQYYRPIAVVGDTVFVYIVPGLLHFCGFATASYAFRVVDNEHLQNLVERVFILAYRPIRLLCLLWTYVAVGCLWLAMMTACVVLKELHVHGEYAQIKWFDDPSRSTKQSARILLGLTMFTHDLVQVVIFTTYAIQCHLLRIYLDNLKEKLLQNTIDPLDWMREMCEFGKLLHHLNRRIATPICWFTLLNLIYTLSATIYTFRHFSSWSDVPNQTIGLTLGNVVLWLLLALFPFFQAASLTLACQRAQTCGHQIRIRPFVHHNTSAEDLNSVLLYSSSLRMSAKLFRMPILGNYLFFVILCLVVTILTFGMCLSLSA